MSFASSANALSKADLLSKYKESDDELVSQEGLEFEKSEEVELSYSKFSHFSALSGVNSDSNADSQTGGRSTSLKSASSPFLKKIQMSMANVEIENFPIRAMESIREVSYDEVSPFVRSSDLKIDAESWRRSSGESVPQANSDTNKNASSFGHQRKISVKMSLTPAQRMEKRPGLRTTNALDEFEFYEKIGRGAYADVFRGLNKKTGKIIAIKQIALEKDYNASALMGEIDLLKILRHQNIVKYHGFVKTSASLNVFLEFCSGGSLRQIYKKQGHGFSESKIVSYVHPILKGLQYLHEQGVVHRDVKAANVLLTGYEEVKLADFGVATKVSNSHNTVVGTPNWMAPETVLGGDGICTASDIWSLGATIVELYTTRPPYHDLNPMATLHAIGTDEHPVLPAGLSPLARDFLLECFQKQSNLRISAKLLLKHRWLGLKEGVKGDTHASNSSNPNPSNQSNQSNQSNRSDSQRQESNPVSTTNSSGRKHEDLTPATQVSNVVKDNPKISGQILSRTELLAKYAETPTDSATETADTLFSASSNMDTTVNIKAALQRQLAQASEGAVEEHDPFYEMGPNDFDTGELEVQEKTAFLLTKLSARVRSCHSATADATPGLEKLTGRLFHLAKKYSTSHDTIVREHGILTLMELLENASEFSESTRLWHHVLGTLNQLFSRNEAQIENFALLGGIPLITRFSKLCYGLPVRAQVVKFVKTLRQSERAMLMFVSSGGIRVLSRFLEEDFDTNPDFSLVAVHCIHEILAKDLTRFKSDMCRILSKHGVVFWFVVLLNRLTKISPQKHSKLPPEQVDIFVDKILEVIRYFGQAEPRVRVNIASPDLFKLLIKVHPALSFPRQMEILRFFRSASCIFELLPPMASADVLEFYVALLRQYTPAHPQYKDVLNVVCPSLYNCCILNHTRERKLAQLGAIPLLRDLSRINLPFRQFVLPVLCELAYGDTGVRALLLKHDVPTVYYNLLVDPYWHYNVMDSILHWSSQDPKFNWLGSATARDCLVSGFMMTSVSNLEAVLENYLKLMTKNDLVVRLLARDSIIDNIVDKLAAYSRAPAAKLSLLRILHQILSYACASGSTPLQSLSAVYTTMSSIVAVDSSVLAQDLATRIISAIGPECR